MKTVFITGATGLLGRAVLRTFLQNDESTRLKLLVRANSEEQLRSRKERLFECLSPAFQQPNDRTRVEGLRGDITLPRMGLPDKKYHNLARSLTGIMHIAASTSWDLPLETLRRTNTAGTQHVAELARLATHDGTLEYFAHVSTAYVAGDRAGVIRETELWEGQGFNNNYERSKFEAEMLIQQMKNEVPIIVFRPSMIIGDSQTGETPHFDVFYYLVKLAVRGRLKALPTRKSALIDMVPSDYAATAIHKIVNQKSSAGNTFHLCSGRDRTPTMNEIFELMTRFFSQNSAGMQSNHFRCPMMLNPTIYKHIISPMLKMTLPSEKRKRLKNVELYIPYTTARKIFDISNTAAAIGKRELAPPLWREYYANIFQYCLDSDWKTRELAV
jgi:thioester reductase-like protein